MQKFFKNTLIYCFHSARSAYSAKQEGFTLLEAMVSIFILLVGVTGSLVLVSSGITNLNVSKNRLIASNLAQEGLEIVHNIRDNNWLNSRKLVTLPSWNDWYGAPNGTGSSCAISSPCIGYIWWSSNFIVSGAEPSNFLRWNLNTNHYAYDGTEGESFSRIITVTDNPDTSIPVNNSVRVQSTVGWGGAGNCIAGGINSGKKYCLTLEEWLYKWR